MPGFFKSNCNDLLQVDELGTMHSTWGGGKGEGKGPSMVMIVLSRETLSPLYVGCSLWRLGSHFFDEVRFSSRKKFEVEDFVHL